MRNIIAGVFVGLTLSCGTANPPSGGSQNVSTFIDDFAAMLCDLAAQCCAPNGFAAPTDCVAQAKHQLHGEIDEEVDAGSTFDSQAGEKCMAAYRTLAPSCPAVFPSSTIGNACRSVLVGNQPPGSACAGGCAPSDRGDVSCLSYSTRGVDGGITESGQICQVVATVAPGEACDDYGRLAFERHCDFTKNSNCIQGICSTPRALGASCSGSYECVPEATCGAGRCVARVPVGGACTSSECVASATCVSGRCEAGSPWKKMCSGDFD